MSESKGLFTKNQNRLMNIAGWANTLSWVVLVLYLILAALTVFLDQANYVRMQAITGGFSSKYDYWELARSDWLYYVLDIGSDILSRVLAGFMNFVILRGIALGLYMVIETDMNYREHSEKEGV